MTSVEYKEKILLGYKNENEKNLSFEDYVSDFFHKNKPEINIKSLDLKIAISSNIFYYQKTLPILLTSLEKAGIEKNNIHIFIGGYNDYKIEKKDYNTYFLDHNSFDLAPLIEISEKYIKAEYWFLIQDTCQVGLHFKKLLYNIPDTRPDAIALSINPCMNIGVYKYDYILTSSHLFKNSKNKDYSEKGLKMAKDWSVGNEDILLKNNLPIYPREADIIVFEDYNSIYNSEIKRRLEYYPSLDLFKYKANYSHGHRTENGYGIKL